MPCKRFDEALNDDALGGDLDPAVADHLTGCAVCQQTLARARGVVASMDADIQQALAIVPPPALEARIRARVLADPAPAGTWRFRWAMASAAAAIATAVFTGPWERTGMPVSPRSADVTLARSSSSVIKTVRSRPVAAETERAAAPRRSGAARTPANVPMSQQQAARVVVVPPEPAEAIRHLVLMVAEGKLRIEPPLVEPAPPTAPAPMTVAPLAIEPLVVAELDTPGPSIHDRNSR